MSLCTCKQAYSVHKWVHSVKRQYGSMGYYGIIDTTVEPVCLGDETKKLCVLDLHQTKTKLIQRSCAFLVLSFAAFAMFLQLS